MEPLNYALSIFKSKGLVMAFLFIGLVMWLSYLFSKHLTKGRIHGSAIAITAGLVLALIGGWVTGGSKGLADVTIFSGVGVMGGGMLRDYAIVSTAFGAKLSEMKKAGLAGFLSLIIGVVFCFFVGAVVAYMFGYRNVEEITTIAAGAVTFIVGPITGAALGVSSDIVALSIAAGVVKSILVMVATPLVAKRFGLDNPQAAMVYGGLMGTTSGTAAGLAATDPRLVPYGAVVATFYTGSGCLLCPSVLYFATRAILG
ncbi:MAG: malonate transporter subunit MadM [Deltaproteobacteria bacterium]|jgi:malonate transporter MadM subunit|nr:malonate transporter subunit MadM [Deltaproteobacteria bacterium]